MKTFTKNDFRRVFDDSSPYWTTDPLRNLIFLRSCQYRANEQLLSYGYLTINEVYRMIGLKEGPAQGDNIGWVFYQFSDDETIRDFGLHHERVDFGLPDTINIDDPDIPLYFDIDTVWSGDISLIQNGNQTTDRMI